MSRILVLATLSILAKGSPVARDDGTGWGSPSSTGSNTAVDVNADLTANGPGWAAASHSDNVQGSSGQDEAAGIALIEENGTIFQLTNIDSDSVDAAQSVTVDNFAHAAEVVNAHASGITASVEYTGYSGAGGQGVSTADGTVSIIVNPLRKLVFL